MSKRKINYSLKVSWAIGKFVSCGVLLGVYFNILHTLPFMRPKDVWWVFALVAYIAVALPIVVHLWDSNRSEIIVKTRFFFFGMSLVSAVFAVVYLVEVFVGNFACTVLANPLYFPISRVPMISFPVSLAIVGLSVLTVLFLKHHQVNTERQIN